VNKAKAEVYVSLQCTTKDGYETIIEYPVPKTQAVKVPAGSCGYVVWAGGKQMSGGFRLGIQEEITLTIYKDRIEIQ